MPQQNASAHCEDNAERLPTKEQTSVSIRFAGDSGDGIQLIGSQFTAACSAAHNDLATLPDYPAEIRAPANSAAGVSAYQVTFSSDRVEVPGDKLQCLLVMNAAALKVHLDALERNGILIANSDGFQSKNLKLAGFANNPLDNGVVGKYKTLVVPITTLTCEALESTGLKRKDAERCKNFFALGLVCCLYDRPIEPILEYISKKFSNNPTVRQANKLALRAGYAYAADQIDVRYRVAPANLPSGRYRQIRGNEAAALGLIAAAGRAGKSLFYVSYPITPASEILHTLARQKGAGVKVFQTEDEIAAMCAVIGGAYGGAMAATATSGPGMALKTEAFGLAVMLELPCVIIDVQRGGPSTGLPTKTEQSDLFQAMVGRNGECPMPVIAAESPSDCFRTAFEAFQIAVRHMTPVIVLSDSYLASGSEPWRVPRLEELPAIDVRHEFDPEDFQPYARNELLARPWVIPGSEGLAHCIGGLEKQDGTGDVSYDGANHARMSELRAEKIRKIADHIPEQQVFGDEEGDVLVVSWGSTFGAVRAAVKQLRGDGCPVSHAHLRYLSPLPKNLGDVMKRYRRVVVPEINLGQLVVFLRSTYLVDATSMTKMEAQPFTVAELVSRIRQFAEEK